MDYIESFKLQKVILYTIILFQETLSGDLNLPERHHSYVFQKWSEMIAVDGAFDKAREVLYEILGINVWSKQMEEINREAGENVDGFYKANPT